MVTVHTPTHLQGTDLAHGVHGFYLAVTVNTIDTRLDVALVGKIDVPFKIVDLYPGDGFLFIPVIH